MSKTIDELVAEAETRIPGGQGRRWYDLIPADERAFVDVLTERARDAGEIPSAPQVCRVLRREFGDQVTASTVRTHFVRAVSDDDR